MRLLTEPGVARILRVLPEARVVGGAVRDALLGWPVADVDFATSRTPDEIVAALGQAGLKPVPTGLAHGTVTAVTPEGAFEITTLRRDTETDGRHATVAFTDDWREDAARRDFTINAMSLDVEGTTHDYFGGREDLAAGRVRFVGEPSARIAEDYLRILRYFRFLARYGRAEPDTATLDALRDGVPGLAILSAERVWSELRRILLADDPVGSLRLMTRLGILQAVLPEGADAETVASLVAEGAPADPLLRMAALLAPGAGAALERLKLSNAERQAVLAMRSGPVPPPDSGDPAVLRSLADETPETLTARSWLRHGARGDALRKRLAASPRPVFPLAGRDAVAAGVPAGPRVGALLREVRTWWLDHGTRPDGDACRAELVRRMRG